MAPEEAPIPSVVALLVCDNIITEARTNKKTLIGVFDRWYVLEIPTQVGSFWVYARLTDAEGKYIFKVKLVNLNNDQLVLEATTKELQARDRLAPLELTFPLPFLPVETLGRYEVQLFANDVYIGRTTVSAVRQEES